MKTTSGGPTRDDVFYFVFSKVAESWWQIPQSHDDGFFNWLQKFPDINLEQFIKSMGCTDDRIFILYRGPDFPVLSEDKKSALKNRLLNFLTTHFDGSFETLTQITEDIFKNYQLNIRHYHNLEHIQHCLWELDQIKDDQVDKVSVELAIWYHDVIYSQTSKLNEINSVKKMKDDLSRFVSDVNLDDVSAIVLSRPTVGTSLTKSQQYFWDIDYSIFGQRELEYMAYKQNIRLEYDMVPSLIFHVKRKYFLVNTLRGGVFQTEEFQKRYQAQAVKNIKNELSSFKYFFLPPMSWKRG